MIWLTRIRGGGALQVCALGMLLVTAAAAASTSPRDVLMRATGDMMTALQVSGDQMKENPALAHRLAEQLVVPLVDFRGISRKTLGEHWRSATAEQRERFTDAFQDFLVNLYVTVMVTYTEDIVSVSEDIDFPPARWSSDEKRASVPMVIRLKGGARAELNYRMNSYSGSWKIHDVNVIGISFASTYQNNFSREIERNGLDGLIARLESRNEENARSPASARSLRAPEF